MRTGAPMTPVASKAQPAFDPKRRPAPVVTASPVRRAAVQVTGGVSNAMSAARLCAPLSPKSPMSPFSPLKAAVDRFYGAAFPMVQPAVRSVRKRYVLKTQKGAEAPLEFQDISPSNVAVNRKHAVDFFRNQRAANERYAAYKEAEERRKAEIRAKSVPSQAAKARLGQARLKLAALSMFQGQPSHGIGAQSGGGGANALLQRLELKKLERQINGEADEFKPMHRAVEVEENKGGIMFSKGAAVVKGRGR